MRAIKGAWTISLLAGAWALWTGAPLALAATTAAPNTPPAACTPDIPGIPCVVGQFTPGTGANDKKADFSDLRKTCDGDVMNQIHARAFMEVQRENIINQTNIRKPDSVLAYTCFDQYIGVASQNAPPIFSESTHWSAMPVRMSVEGKPPTPATGTGGYPLNRTLRVNMGSGNNVPLMNGMALGPVSNFTRDNFQHDFLGGAQAGMTYALGSTVQRQAQMNCAQMQAIWHAAKCQNAEVTAPSGTASGKTFYSLEDLMHPREETDEEKRQRDPRKLPAECRTTTGITEALMKTATNPPPRYEQFHSGQITENDENGRYEAVKVDGIRHLRQDNRNDYFDPKLQPFDGTNMFATAGCGPPIPTGLWVIKRHITYDERGEMQTLTTRNQDYVCPNPECYTNMLTGIIASCEKLGEKQQQ